MTIHTVQKNETIFDIGEKYGLSAQKIAETNGLFSPTQLAEGRQLAIIMPTKTYTVKTGDTLNKIGEKYGIKKTDILAMNPGLWGKERLYTGQLLYLKQDQGLYGIAAANGYCYYGCRNDKFISLLPYMNYVTLCSARSDGEKIYSLFNEDQLLSLIHQENKFPILRIYLSALPKKDNEKDFLSSVLLLLKAKKYGGVTFGGLGDFPDCEVAQFVLNAKRFFMEQEITLGVECADTSNCKYTDYADLCILLYDKVHLSDIPTFDEGERKFYTCYADEYESTKTFMDISSFAYAAGKYVDKEKFIQQCDRQGSSIENCKERLISHAKLGKKASNREVIFENAENTKAKLQLVSELGLLGISFDVMRIPLTDIILFNSMFKPISAAAYFDEPGRCTGGM